MRRFKLILLFGLIYVVGFILSVAIYIGYANKYVNPRLSRGIDKMLFAKYEFFDVENNRVNFLKEFPGKIKLIGFWTLNCSFCIDDLEAFYQLDLTKNKEFYILAVNKDGIETWTEYLREKNLQFKNPQIKHFHLDDENILKALEIEFYPSYFLLEKDGRLHSRCSYSFVMNKIKKVLDEDRLFADFILTVYKYFPCGGLGKPASLYSFIFYPVLLVVYFFIRSRF